MHSLDIRSIQHDLCNYQYFKMNSGFVVNKCRDFAAEKLKDGDTTDQKFREIIVRDLNDIKTTLDCLSRKDLLSSYSFLKEGVLLLNLALGQSPGEHTTISEQDELIERKRQPQQVKAKVTFLTKLCH